MAIEGFKRKRTAVLNADVKEYSRAMGETATEEKYLPCDTTLVK